MLIGGTRRSTLKTVCSSFTLKSKRRDSNKEDDLDLVLMV